MLTTCTIFEDDRFPDVQIRWHGGATFNIYVETGHGESNFPVWVEADVFTHYGRNCNQQTAMDEAQYIAREHFEDYGMFLKPHSAV